MVILFGGGESFVHFVKGFVVKFVLDYPKIVPAFSDEIDSIAALVVILFSGADQFVHF